MLADLRARFPGALTVYSQDDPTFPEATGGAVDDRDLDVSFALDLDTVPTLLRVVDGAEVARVVGWSRDAVGGVHRRRRARRRPAPAPPRLRVADAWTPPSPRPGRPGRASAACRRAGSCSARRRTTPRRCTSGAGPTGCPLVPPTPERVVRMLAGTTRAADEVVVLAPPDLVECTVEKVAINAVMAGCRPEYLPVVLAAVEAACTDEFNMHGLLATTWFSGPVVVVNGPIDAGDRHEQRHQRARARATAPTRRSGGRSSS